MKLPRARDDPGGVSQSPWSAPLVIAAWLGVVGAATWRSLATPVPGTADVVPERLGPRAAARLGWSGERPLCVLAAAPGCALLPATLDALATALPDDRAIDLRVLVCSPAAATGAGGTDATAALCRQLPPGVVRLDPDARLARALGATTSGHVNVYDDRGALTFAGGLVDGRGTPHPAALRALRTALGGPAPRARTLPVYGQPLAEAQP